jgi:hypothetical protein
MDMVKRRTAPARACLAAALAVVLAALAGCAGTPVHEQAVPSPCAAGEASYACQVERYQNVNVE